MCVSLVTHKTEHTMTETPETEVTKVTAPVVITKNDEITLNKDDIVKKVQQRVKRETHLYAGCGFSKKKKQLLDAFWGTMWTMGLERAGWLKVRSSFHRRIHFHYMSWNLVKIAPPSAPPIALKFGGLSNSFSLCYIILIK